MEAKQQSAAFNQQEVFDLGKESLDYLGALARPEGHISNFPPTFHAVWDLITQHVHKERDFSKIALGLPRGFGKTTLMKLFLLYCILYTERKFILIVAANADLATNILTDVFLFLDTPNIRAVFGDWNLGKTKDTASVKAFGFRGRNITVVAIGEKGSTRGLNIQDARPDIILMDDIQTREDANSQIVSDAIYDKMFGTTMKAKAPSGCLYMFVANMYPTKHSILKRLKQNPSWIKFIAGGILADGSSLWEAVQPIEQLLEEYESDKNAGKAEIFHAEVLNDENATVNTAIDINLIPEPMLGAEIAVGSFIVVDPSNDKINSDLVSIGYFEVYSGVPVLTEVIDEKLSPGDIVRRSIELAVKHGCKLIVTEANAFQYSLLYWFRLISTQLGIVGIKYEPIYSGVRSKNTRILEMFKQLTSAEPELLLAPAVRSMVLNYITQFNPMKSNNVDNVLDLLTYAPRILAEMPHLMVINSAVNQYIPEQGTRHTLF